MPLNLGLWPAVVAHRGASAHYPENTLSAFEAAIDAGADIVELDVRRSSDGGLVVTHDATFTSLAAEDVNVADLPLAEIKRQRPQIPTLDETLHRLCGRVALEVEIKNVPHEVGYEPSGAEIATAVVAAVRKWAFTDAFIASFDAECLRVVREVGPDIATGLLIDASQDLNHALDVATNHHEVLLPEANALESAGRAFIERAHERDVRICAWTVDDPAAIERLFELGADGVETNDPALGVRVRDRLRRP